MNNTTNYSPSEAIVPQPYVLTTTT